jgi:hypothetical protein
MKIFFHTAALAAVLASPVTAHADDTASPCDALKRIVAAAPNFSSITPDDGKAVAQPHGQDAQCGAKGASYQCSWTKGADGTSSDALESVAADIASCLPDATHDVNSPARQHFYIGAKGQHTQITAITAGASRISLSISR